MAASESSRQPDEQFDELAQQHHAAQFGPWVFLATEILLFGALFASYTIARLRFSEAFQMGSQKTDVLTGGIESVILLLSSVLITWALALLEPGSRRLLTALPGATALIGVIFLVLHGSEYVKQFHEHLIPGLHWDPGGKRLPAMQQISFLCYAMTLYHSLHVLVGVVSVVTIAVMVWRGSVRRNYTTPLVLIALYWHLVDIVWIFLFPLIYLIGRT